MTGFINAVAWLTGMLRATFRPRPRMSFWEWADKHVVIPDECGGPMPGQLHTSRFPVMRGLFDLAQQPHVHFFSFCASVRVGKTLLSIVIMLYWLACRLGSVVWLDPSGASAKKVSKSELQPFIEKCAAVWQNAVLGKTTWQLLWKTFRGKILRIVGSGAEADMHGFNAELAILNELDRCKEAVVRRRGKKNDGREDAAAADKIIARTVLFPYTRLILENSSPGVAGEFSPIWVSFLRGSQHHCYLPCPHCTDAAKKKGKLSKIPKERPVGWSEASMDPFLCGWQRLTFASENKLVPFDENLLPLLDAKGRLKPSDEWREEVTGQIRFEQFAIWREVVSVADATKKVRKKVGYDHDRIETGATYQCACCKKDIEAIDLRWMLNRYRWVAHHPGAPRDRVSAHLWRAYSPPELGGGFGLIVKEFLESKGDVAALIKLNNFTFAKPFIRAGSGIKEDDLDRVIARTPHRYVKGQIPCEVEVLTMTVDKQRTEFWYSIRGWGVIWDHEDQPSFSALLDWGRANSWDEILELAGKKPDANGELRRFTWTNPKTGEVREYEVAAGLVDSGDGHDTDEVYKFCLNRTDVFDPYKGVSGQHTRWNRIRMSQVLEEQLDLWLCWSDYFANNLYIDCIAHGQENGVPLYWWLPVDLDDDYKKQLTNERKTDEGWDGDNNHLGDTEKMQRCLKDTVEVRLDQARKLRAAEAFAAAKKVPHN